MTHQPMHGAQHPFLLAQLEECALRAAHTGRPSFSAFLDPAEAMLAQRAAQKQGMCCGLWGGYEEAERCIACFFEAEAQPQAPQWPLRWLQCSWDSRYASVHHRDLLGALMGQGIQRDTLGDILLAEGSAYCAATPEIAAYLAGTLREAGRATLRCAVLEKIPALPQPKGVTRRETVASLRLDAVAAAGWNLTRAEAGELIRQGKVRVNYLLEQRPDAHLSQGARISARGNGCICLEEIGRTNKKGRVAIVLTQYR